MTPNTSDWSEYDALHLMGHVEARRSGQPLSSWREEVLAARALRDALQPADISLMDPEVPAIESPVLAPAKAASQLLSERGLDGRDLNAAGTDLRTLNPTKVCLLYTSPSPRDRSLSRMPSSA